MPRRPANRTERERYAHAFDENPFEGADPFEAYRTLRWGVEPREVFEMAGPEPELVGLGRLAAFEYADGDAETYEEVGAPLLALGMDSNRLYVVPQEQVDNPKLFDGPFDDAGEVAETHYYAVKGDDDAYWYHEHQEPYPTLWVNDQGAAVLEPADNGGEPSYAVAEEGIIG